MWLRTTIGWWWRCELSAIYYTLKGINLLLCAEALITPCLGKTIVDSVSLRRRLWDYVSSIDGGLWNKMQTNRLGNRWILPHHDHDSSYPPWPSWQKRTIHRGFWARRKRFGKKNVFTFSKTAYQYCHLPLLHATTTIQIQI